MKLNNFIQYTAVCPICRMMKGYLRKDKRFQLLHDHYKDDVCQVCLNSGLDPIPWAELIRAIRVSSDE